MPWEARPARAASRTKSWLIAHQSGELGRRAAPWGEPLLSHQAQTITSGRSARTALAAALTPAAVRA